MSKQSLKILVIDDDAMDRKAVERLLKDHCELVFAVNGKEALECLRGQIIDCALVDYHLPDTTGLSLVPSFVNRNIPVIMLTGQGSEHLAVVAMKEGVLDYIVKDDLAESDILKLIESAIQKKQQKEKVELESVLLKKLAYHDALTHLANRSLFDESLIRAISLANRHERMFALLFIDIDDFKPTNDTYGHIIGDMLLQHIAMRLQSNCRKEDIVARIGGDEFAIILNETNSPHDAGIVAKKLIQILSEPYVLEENRIVTSVSIGIACYKYTDTSVTAVDLRNYADIALYKAKELGKNNYQYFSKQIHDKHLTQLRVEKALSKALEDSEVDLMFQPVVSLSSDKAIVGIRTLFSWEHDDFGHFDHQAMVKMLNDNGLYIIWTEWVIDHILTALRRFREIDNYDCSVWLPIMSEQLRSKHFVASLQQLYSISYEEKQFIQIELIDYQSNYSDIDVLQDAITNISQQGFPVHLSRFGMDMVQFELFKDTDIKGLVIASDLIEQIPGNQFAEKTIQTIIQFAENFELMVTAAGMQNKSQFDFLSKTHCHAVIGEYLFKPLTLEEMVLFLEDYYCPRIA